MQFAAVVLVLFAEGRLPQDLLQIESLLADVTIDPTTWTQVLGDICGRFGIHGAVVLPFVDRVPGAPMTATLEPLADGYFRGGWQQRDERNKLMPKLVRTGLAVDQDIHTLDEIRRHEYWLEFLEPHGLRWFAGIRVSAAEDLWCLALQRTPQQGPFSGEEQARLVQLSAPLSRAATLVKRLADARLDGISDALHLIGQAGFVIDRHGRIVRHNAEAEDLLGGILSLRRGELTVTGRPDLSQALRQHLDATIRIDLDPLSRFLDGIAVPRDVGLPLFLQAHPLRRELASCFMPGCGLLLVADPASRQAPAPSMLRTLFELTEREVQLVRMLADGRSLSGAAGRMGIGYETARSYLKSIFMKTGSRGQSDLMAMVARLGRAGGRQAGPA